MKNDMAPVFIGATDMFLCVLVVVIVAVAPRTPASSGPQMTAQKLVTAEWDVEHYDADVDLWIVTPSKKPVFFGSRQVRCVTLDQDNRGWVDSKVTLADGSTAKIDRAKETAALRCLEPGHYDVGVNLYSHRDQDGMPKLAAGLPVHIEIVDVNPTKILYAGDVKLTADYQTINVVSFDLLADGKITLTTPPLTPVTDTRGNE